MASIGLVWHDCDCVAFICWYAGIKRCSAYAAAGFSGMMPFTSLFLSVTVLGETAGCKQWLGGALIVLGMMLIGKREIEK